MKVIIANAFITACSFADPSDCVTKFAHVPAVPGYTIQSCLAEAREAGNKWLDANAPTKIIARIRCEFVEGSGA